MRLTEGVAAGRLGAHDHGVLATAHPERGVDAVPVVYAAVDGLVGIPVDTVKPKASTMLQRERNLRADPRATLLVEQWDRVDWSRLWWVRAHLSWLDTEVARPHVDRLADALVDRYPQYRDRPFTSVLVFEIVAVSGWESGSESGSG